MRVTSDAAPMLLVSSAAAHIRRAITDRKLNHRATITGEVCATTDKELNRRAATTAAHENIRRATTGEKFNRRATITGELSC